MACIHLLSGILNKTRCSLILADQSSKPHANQLHQPAGQQNSNLTDAQPVDNILTQVMLGSTSRSGSWLLAAAVLTSGVIECITFLLVADKTLLLDPEMPESEQVFNSCSCSWTAYVQVGCRDGRLPLEMYMSCCSCIEMPNHLVFELYCITLLADSSLCYWCIIKKNLFSSIGGARRDRFPSGSATALQVQRWAWLGVLMQPKNC